eukprot:2564215-Karenia_brevis.AAC.1
MQEHLEKLRCELAMGRARAAPKLVACISSGFYGSCNLKNRLQLTAASAEGRCRNRLQQTKQDMRRNRICVNHGTNTCCFPVFRL